MCNCHCKCEKKHHKCDPNNFEGFYTAEGHEYLLKNGMVSKNIGTRTYLITKVGHDMYKVVMNSLTPSQFTLDFLFYKKDNKLYSSSNAGIDIISCEENKLVADFSTNNPGKLNGRFILTPALL